MNIIFYISLGIHILGWLLLGCGKLFDLKWPSDFGMVLIAIGGVGCFFTHKQITGGAPLP